LLVYRTSVFTVFMARRVVKLVHIGLANLLLGRTAMPELIQEQADREHIVREINELLFNPDAVQKQKNDFAELRALLGETDPAAGVVRLATELASRKS